MISTLPTQPRSWPEEGSSPEEVLTWAYGRFEKVALVASFQAESSVLIDLCSRVTDRLEVLTLDTGRLPEETFQIMERLRDRYRFRLHMLSPDPEEVAAMTGEHGPNLFRQDVELRLRCCEVRKTRPLDRALGGYQAWITGVRRDQAPSRASTPIVSPDPQRWGVLKLAPLAEWSSAQVWEHIRHHDIPTHPLYNQGYASIGCAPCTRPIQPGESERAGRWWWEQGATKECGLHRSLTDLSKEST